MAGSGPTLTLSVVAQIATTISFWRTDTEEIRRNLSSALSTWLRSPELGAVGSIGAAVLAAIDGERIALYGQWVGAEERDAALGRLATAWRDAPTDSDAFELILQEPVGNVRPVLRDDLAALGEFWMAPGDQAKLIERERTAAKTALRSAGGILSANFHRGLKGTRIVNFSQVADRDAIARLATTAGFDSASGYWRDIARNEFHVYALADVVLGASLTEEPT